MIRVLSLIVLALAGCSMLVTRSSGHSVLGDQSEVRIVRTADLFHDLDDHKRDAKSDRKFLVDGKVYHAKYDTTRSLIPLAFMDDSAKEQHFEMKGERDYYHDAKNHALFTVSRRLAQNGIEKKSLRANILLPDSKEHLVLEPHEESDLNMEGFHTYSKIYKTSKVQDMRTYDVANATVNRDFVMKSPLSLNEPATTPGAVNNYVELFMIADYWYYQAVAKRLGKNDDASIALFIEAYFAQLEYLTSQCYVRSLASTSNLKISVIATQIYVLKSAQSSPFTGPSYFTTLNGQSNDRTGKQYINAETGLDALNDWATTNLKGKTYDSLVGITAANICDVEEGYDEPDNDGLVGLAPLEGVCRSGRNAFIAEDWLDYSRAYTIAHELAHNLGAQHDDYYNDPSCTDDDYYIMAPSNEPDNFLNSFYFSPCSIRIFVQRIYTKNQASCLANQVQPDSDITRFSSFFPGQVYNLTQQCQLEFGPTFFADLPSDYSEVTSDAYVCENIFCTQEGTLTVTSRSYSFQPSNFAYGSPAYEKTSCGNGKWCVAGKCVADSMAPTGDIPVETRASCSKIGSYLGKDYVCNTYFGACYTYCNPGSKVIQPLSGQTMSNWLATNNVDNTHVL